MKRKGLFVVSVATLCALATQCFTVTNNSVKCLNAAINDYSSLEVAKEEGYKMNEKVAEDGVVLLKNDGTLPLNKGMRVNVFGLAQNALVETDGTVGDSLTNCGFVVNPALKSFYDKSGATYEDYGNELQLTNIEKQSLSLYKDVGIVVIGRGTPGESSDPSTATGENEDEKYLGNETGWEHENHSVTPFGESKHLLQLTQSEQEMIKLAEESCEKVIVLYSSSYTFEMANLEADSKINAIVWMGRLGSGSPVDAVAKILNGDVNPSGKTVDVWDRDFTNDPTYFTNFQEYYDTPDGAAKNFYIADYEEDIYTSYKYFETYWNAANGGDGSYVTKPTAKVNGKNVSAEEWYDYNVVYPFGYGLSYTSFKFELVGLKTEKGDKITDGATLKTSDFEAVTGAAKNKTMGAQVKVTNTGSVAGKEVVQAYLTAPYTGGIEKGFVNLVGYEKTNTLKPGESQVVTVTMETQDMASYDYKDDNKNGHKGYELEKGDYTLRFSNTSSHKNFNSDAYADIDFTIGNDIYIDYDDYSDNKIENLFSNGDDYDSVVDGMTTMSRKDLDGTKPKAEKRSLTQAQIDIINKYNAIDADNYDDNGMAWEKAVADIPSNWTQGQGTLNNKGQYATLLADMEGIPLFDSTTESGYSAQWDAFLNQLTYAEIATLLNDGKFRSIALQSIGKVETNHKDGPNYVTGGNYNVNAAIVGATFNKELIEQYGKVTGDISLAANVTGYYAPCVNLRRSQFFGRSAECYSQDAFLAGEISASYISGLQSRGVSVFVKHFAIYDGRNVGEYTYCNVTEQTLREVYFKPFKKAMQKGGATATMSAMASLGYIAGAHNYNMLQSLARDEWGWTGMVVTDFLMRGNITCDGVIRASGTLPLYTNYSTDYNGISGTWDATLRNGKGDVVIGSNRAESPTQYYSARQAVAYLLYNEVNTGGNHNGIDATSYEVSINGKQGNAIVPTNVLPNNYRDGHVVNYEIVDGTLPSGVSFDSNTGVISGTPTESGQYSIKINTLIDNWVSLPVTIDLSIDAIVSTNPNGTNLSDLKVDDTVSTYVDFESTDIYSRVGEPDSVTYKVIDGELPEGLTLDSATGRISGKATKAGNYTVTVGVNVSKVGEWTLSPNMAPLKAQLFSMYSVETEEELFAAVSAQGEAMLSMVFTRDVVDETYFCTINVNIAEASVTPVEPEVDTTKADIEALQAKIDSLQTTIGSLQTTIDTLKAESNTNTETSGCGGSIGTASAILFALAAAGTGLFISKKKEEKED